MHAIRTHTPLVVVGLAVVVFAAFVPVLTPDFPSAILPSLWLLVPAMSIVAIRRTASRSDEQPVALVSLTLLRAPPTAPAHI